MLKKLQITNFQSHKDTELEFVNGVNVIIGTSDSGKTAILRAMKWVINNRPGGDSFRSYWGGDTYVTIHTEECNIITRTKTKSDNAYEADGMDFHAFGQDVPEEITKILNVDEINLQQQLDSPFLLSSTSGEVASHFNKVAKLDRIDKGLQNIQREIRTLTTDIDYKQKDRDEQKELLKAYKDLDKFEADLEILEQMYEDRVKIISDIKKLEKIIERVEESEAYLLEKQEMIKAEKDIDVLLQLYETHTTKSAEFKTLKKLAVSIYNISENIKNLEKQVKASEDIDLILNMYVKRTEIGQRRNQIRNIVYDIEKVKASEERMLKQLTDLETEFHENIPEMCPLCETKLK